MRSTSEATIALSPTQLGFTPEHLRDAWQWDETQIRTWQLEQLNHQLRTILPDNRFYREAFREHCQPDGTLQLNTLDELSRLPFTTKQDLVASPSNDTASLSAHHTHAPPQYSRLHRTSGTSGRPLIVMDTQDDWRWWSATWQHVLEAAGVERSDRVFLAFSFGPFIGFWSAHQACVDRGATVIPGGGLSSLARLEFIEQTDATVICCTPSYALHLAEVAERESFDLSRLNVRRIIVAGEAGGSVPSVREMIQEAWHAQVVDHSGATEIGPWGFGWPERIGLHVIETSFIAELIPVAQADDVAELVLTSIGRMGAPVIRYRTGDAVRTERPTSGPCRFLWLPDGVVGRVDNMVTIRGVNVFPSSIDALVREDANIDEYRVRVTRSGQLDQLQLEVEASTEACEALEKRLTARLGLRIPVTRAQASSLPRSEGKSRRWQDERF